MAAGLLDKTVDHAEPEPRALADLLGREERLEDALGDLRRDSGAGVLDANPDIVAGLQFGIPFDIRLRSPRRWSVSIRSLPPSGMASRALMHRLRMAVSVCNGSA